MRKDNKRFQYAETVALNDEKILKRSTENQNN